MAWILGLSLKGLCTLSATCRISIHCMFMYNMACWNVEYHTICNNIARLN